MEKKINPEREKNITITGNGVSIKDLSKNNFKYIIYIKLIRDKRNESKPKNPIV